MPFVDREGDPITPAVWRRLFADYAYRTVLRTPIEEPEGECLVTWVGHAGEAEGDRPRLFLAELMLRDPVPPGIAGSQGALRCVREEWACSEAEAVRRHDELCMGAGEEERERAGRNGDGGRSKRAG